MRKFTAGLLVVMLVLSMVLMPACGKKEDKIVETTEATVEESRTSRAYVEEFFEAFLDLAVPLVDYMEFKFDIDNPLMKSLSYSEQITVLENQVERLGRLEVVISEGEKLMNKYSGTDLGFSLEDLEWGLELLEELNLIAEEAMDSPPHS